MTALAQNNNNCIFKLLHLLYYSIIIFLLLSRLDVFDCVHVRVQFSQLENSGDDE